MKKVPLSYYVNLVIVEESMKFYDGNNKNATISDYSSWFSYVETYIKSNAKFPQRLMSLVWKLNMVLGTIFGFNPDIAMKFIVGFFTNNKLYNHYLDYVTIKRAYLETKN